nr:FadR/GntR family transcriptional regulator [uncultured Moellerella sp.]
MQFIEQRIASEKNLSYIIAEILGKQILAGDYPPESILPNELVLAEQFKASRTAIREAIKILAAKGMLLPRPRIGTRIMPSSHWNYLDQDLLKWWMSSDKLNQVIQHFYFVRLAIEPQACYLAAFNGTVEQKQQLKLLAREMQLLSKNFDRERWLEVDYLFHQKIYHACANPFLVSFANLFRSAYQNYFDTITEDQVIDVDIHQQLADEIIAGNAPEAFNLCYRLLMTNKD